MEVRLIDVSEGGVQVESKLGLPPASACELKILASGSELTLRAQVRRCRAQLTKTGTGCKVCYRSGLEFVGMTDKQIAELRKLISGYCCSDGGVAEAATITQGAVVGGSLYTV